MRSGDASTSRSRTIGDGPALLNKMPISSSKCLTANIFQSQTYGAEACVSIEVIVVVLSNTFNSKFGCIKNAFDPRGRRFK